MGRGGRPSDRADGPERKCIATGEISACDTLVRFVVGPENQVVPDVLGKLPGRGMWVSADRDAITKSATKGLFSRASKTKVTASPDLADQVEKQLKRRVIELISLSRKSGHAVTGFEKVKDWLVKEQAEILLQAADGSERGKSKLRPPFGGSHIDWLTADELGLAFGRQTVIHGALASGGLAQRVVQEAQRLKGVRGIAVAGATGKEKTAR
ncbi:RNA-binding protein [Shimia abyssi]|uniref:YlxR domain-containing protein n=1 Tax=Shimia abyssi TaxID=1662395 RepID=A0A2P8F8L2_9RHOB|nr:hypothetical protein CLV88_11373 [Shimia abyssi]